MSEGGREGGREGGGGFGCDGWGVWVLGGVGLEDDIRAGGGRFA